MFYKTPYKLLKYISFAEPGTSDKESFETEEFDRNQDVEKRIEENDEKVYNFSNNFILKKLLI